MKCTSDMNFPIRFKLPGVLLLRRESKFRDVPISMRFDLIDEDGNPAGLPHRFVKEDVFPDGYRFYNYMVHLDFEFPKPGQYRLDITVDEEFAANVYSYDIDIVPK